MRARLALSLCVGVAVASLAWFAPGATAAATPVSTVDAERYFTCPAGYTFRTASDAAHCKRPGRYELKPLLPCKNEMGIGLFPRTDHVGNKDMCAGTNPITGEIAVERGCQLGFSKRIVNGRDQCRKWHAGDIVAPSVQVNR